MKIATREARRVIGLSIVTDNATEAQPEKGKIGALWQRSHQEGLMAKLGGPLVGVYTDYEGGVNDPYTLIVGVLVDNDHTIPKGMVATDIPAGRYGIFENKGEIPAVVISTWVEIWNHFTNDSGGTKEAPKRSFATDIEIFGHDGIAIEIGLEED